MCKSRLCMMLSMVFVGFCGALSYWAHFLDQVERTPIAQVLWVVYLTGLFVVLIFGFGRWMSIRFGKLPRSRHYLRGSFALVISGLLAVLQPSFFVLDLKVPVQLAITLTGEKNPLAVSSQAWLRVRLPNGGEIPFDQFDAGPGWQVDPKGAIFSRDPALQPSYINWGGKVSGDVTVVFSKHRWGGIVTVNWNHQGDTRYDLYSDVSEALVLKLLVPSRPRVYVWGYRVALWVASFVSVATLCWAGGVVLTVVLRIPDLDWFLRRLPRGKGHHT